MERHYDTREHCHYFVLPLRDGGEFRNYSPHGWHKVMEHLTQQDVRVPRWVTVSEDPDGNPILTARAAKHPLPAFSSRVDVVEWLRATGANREGR